MKTKRPSDTKIHILAKVLMTAIFMWSGFLWCGVSIIFYITDEKMPYIATNFIVSVILLLIALILCWLRLYIWQFPFCAFGLAIYLSPASELITLASRNQVIFKPSFELRYLPMVAFGLIALIMFIARLWQFFRDKAADRDAYDNSPSQSILDKRVDE